MLIGLKYNQIQWMCDFHPEYCNDKKDLDKKLAQYELDLEAYKKQGRCGRAFCRRKRPVKPEKPPKRLDCCFKCPTYDDKDSLYHINNLVQPLCKQHHFERAKLERLKAAIFI